MLSGFLIRRSEKTGFVTFLVCLLAVIISSPFIMAKDTKTTVLRSSVYKLKYLPAAQAKQYLSDLKIGTDINKIPNLNAIIVTADNPSDLRKATSLIKIIDSEQPFVIRTLLKNPDIQKLPNNKQIQSMIGNISIGTFSDPPVDTEKPIAIVDIHNSDLIVVALAKSALDIEMAIQQLLSDSGSQKTRPAIKAGLSVPEEKQKTSEAAPEPKPEPAPEPQPEPEAKTPAQIQEEFFQDELFDVLTEAEKQSTAPDAEEPDPETAIEPGRKEPVTPAPLITEPAKPALPKGPPVVVYPIQYQDPEILAAGTLRQVFSTEVRRGTISIVADQKASSVIVRADENIQQQIAELIATIDKAPKPVTPPMVQTPVKSKVQTASTPSKPSVSGKTVIPQAEEELELSIILPEKVKITELIELVGKQLGLNYMYDAKKVTGDIMLKVHDGRIKVKDIYALLESALKQKKLVMTRRGNLVTIVKVEEAMDYDPMLRINTEDIQPGDVMVTSVFKLKHISTESAQAMLTNMKLGTSFNAIPETRTLIVTGYSFRMQRIKDILDMVDVQGKKREFRFRQLKYTVASVLVPKIKDLAEQLGTVSISIVATPQKPAPPVRTSVRGRTTVKKPTTTAKTAMPAGEKGIYLDTDDRTNRILIIGLTEDIELIEGLIDTLDVEQQDLRSITEYEIQYVDPQEIIDTLSDLGIVQATKTSGLSTTRRSTSRTPATRKPADPAIKTGSGDAQPTDEPQIAILETTNSLLVNATPEQHASIAMVIAHVDRELEETATPYVIYPLENQDPELMSEILIKLFEKTSRSARTTTKSSKVQTVAKPQSREDVEIIIIPDPETYSLIVFGNKKDQQVIAKLIKELDKSRHQVLLDVTLVEVTKDNEFNLDLDIIGKYNNFATGGTMESGGLVTALLDPFPTNKIFEARSNDGTGTAFYSDRHIQALLEVMDKKNYGRVLARPSILVKDNQEGEIKTENTIYIAEEKSNIVTGGINSTNITTSDINFKPYESGITLTITPHIASEKLLQLDIVLVRTDFKNAADNTATIGDKTVPKPLDTVSSTVTTLAIIPNGATIILGGIETLNQNRIVTKIPILGDIPIIGMLFRGTDESDKQSKLYIFVKANIIQPGDELTGRSDIERISQKKRRSFEEEERTFQGLSLVPGLKAEPLDPVEILEDDEYLQKLQDLAQQTIQEQKVTVEVELE